MRARFRSMHPRFLSAQRPGRALGIGALLVLMAGLLPAETLGAPPTAVSFASPAFQRVWARTDQPVADHSVTRGFYWGPAPGAVKQEAYAEGDGGARLVQYFEKSRMELNHPNGDPTSPFYVTNGLLTVELVTGQMQVGDHRFIHRYPAEIPLAGDSDDPTGPTYASFNALIGGGGNRLGTRVNQVVDRAGDTATDFSLEQLAAGEIVYHEAATDNNIPAIFWQFLNASGPLVVNGRPTTGRLSDPWFYAAGYPITDAYWAHAKIAGHPNTLVLVQLYQRRVLTYVPSAPAAFQVQVGNIGQHYYDWRYNDAGKPAPAPTPPLPSPTPLPPVGPSGLTVFAASSLQDAFAEAAAQFKGANPTVSDVQFNFAGSAQLEAQVAQGAPADVFVSADKLNMTQAMQAGLIDGPARELARNGLTVVVPQANPGHIQTLHDLGRPGVTLALVAAGEPEGVRSGEVLDNLAADPAYGAGFKQQVLDNVVSREDNVRAVLARVQRGEVDAGILYVTDALAANAAAGGGGPPAPPGVLPPVAQIAIPDQDNVTAIYFMAVVQGAAHPAAAHAWIDYLRADAGQAVLLGYGFMHASDVP